MFKVRHDNNNVIIVANAGLHSNDIGLTTAQCKHAKQYINFTLFLMTSE